MNKVSRNITYLSIIVVIVLSINTIYTFKTGQAQINNMFSEMYNLDIKEDKNEIKNVINTVYSNNKSNKTLLKAKTLDAYIKYKDEDYEGSIEILNNKLFDIDNKKYYDEIMTEVYKLKYLNYIALNNGQLVKKNFDKLTNLDIYSDKYLAQLIDLFSNSFANLLGIDNGTDIASELVDKLVAISSELDNYEKNIDLYKNAGTIYMMKNQLDISLEYQIKALNLAISKSDKNQISTMLVEISGSYILQESYKEAIETIKYCIENYKLDINIEVDLLSYLSLAYIETEEYYEAEEVSKKLEEKILELDEDLKIANKIWLDIGYADIYNHLGEYDKTEEYLKSANELYEKYKDISFLGSDASILIEYGDMYYNLGEYQKALYNHIKAYELLKLRSSENGTTKILESISDDYYKLGDIEVSNHILKEIKNIYDREIKDSNNQKMQSVYNSIMIQEKNNKIKSMSKNKQILIAIILTLGIVLIIVYINSKIIQYKKEKIKILNDKLIEENIKDGLTGICNRKGLKQYLQEIENNWNSNDKYAFFMIDIDYFKLYNDNYGHIQGDVVLKRVSKEIQSACEQNEAFVARYGGEEFIIVLKYNDESEVFSLAHQIYKLIESAKIEHKYSMISDRVTLSSGVCYGKIEKDKFVDAINQADKLLYKSKEAGRNRYTILEFKY